MSDVADKYADLIVITDDNPRFEEPSLIRGQLMKQSRKYIEIAILRFLFFCFKYIIF